MISDGRSDPRATRADGGQTSPETSLPPQGSDLVRLLAVSGEAVAAAAEAALEALVSAAAPELVVATPPQPSVASGRLDNVHDGTVLVPGRGVRPRQLSVPGRDWTVVTVPNGVADIEVEGSSADADTDQETETSTEHDDRSSRRLCVTPRLSLEVNPYERSTTVDGLDSYCETIPTRWQTDGTVHCSTQLRPGYRTLIDRPTGQMPVVGLGENTAALGVGAGDDEPTAAVLECFPGGTVRAETVAPSSFGLTGLDEVGPRRAERLRRAGYRTPAAVADASPTELAGLDGFGASVVEEVRAAATARTDGRIVPTGNGALPEDDPVFVDIETDGLEPSVAWLVGVLDGGATDGRYMPFREPAPGRADHLEAFLAWADANARGRPIVAWNGYRFDFPVLAAQIRERCPGYTDTWEELYQFDPLWWARRADGGNAALPGVDNTLETVAEALGWHSSTTGIDGATVATVYTAYRRRRQGSDDPEAVTEPDWDRLEAYCEDDVRALATIYEALETAARREREAEPGRPSSTETTQGALSDFQ